MSTTSCLIPKGKIDSQGSSFRINKITIQYFREPKKIDKRSTSKSIYMMSTKNIGTCQHSRE